MVKNVPVKSLENTPRLTENKYRRTRMVSVTRDNEILNCTFLGRLDTLNCEGLENDILAKIDENCAGIVFNLKDVDYIASSFLRICLLAAKEVGGDNFSIVNVHPLVKKVLKLSAFDKMFSIK